MDTETGADAKCAECETAAAKTAEHPVFVAGCSGCAARWVMGLVGGGGKSRDEVRREHMERLRAEMPRQWPAIRERLVALREREIGSAA